MLYSCCSSNCNSNSTHSNVEQILKVKFCYRCCCCCCRQICCCCRGVRKSGSQSQNVFFLFCIQQTATTSALAATTTTQKSSVCMSVRLSVGVCCKTKFTEKINKGGVYEYLHFCCIRRQRRPGILYSHLDQTRKSKRDIAVQDGRISDTLQWGMG